MKSIAPTEEIKSAYNRWAAQYDTNNNKTRDLEAIALRDVLSSVTSTSCLEIGCGTGKNTEWLCTRANQVLAVDFSEEMLLKAREKITAPNVRFQKADITERWSFGTASFDLICFSLVLEHIQDLDVVFKQTANALTNNGRVYIGELHPFKQYAGSKARFETEQGQQVVPCYNHHLSDFTMAAKRHGLNIIDINEYFDNEDRNSTPRILALQLVRNNV